PGLVKVTVFGATGVVGQALVPLLAAHELSAVSRSARHEPGRRYLAPPAPPRAEHERTAGSRSARDEPGARYVVADAASGDGVAAALEGADVVYYLVHSLGAGAFEEEDRAAAETVSHE